MATVKFFCDVIGKQISNLFIDLFFSDDVTIHMYWPWNQVGDSAEKRKSTFGNNVLFLYPIQKMSTCHYPQCRYQKLVPKI